MRILHTSDWHLGRSFHGLSLHDKSCDLLRELLETVRDQAIDVLLVSGDIYDQAQPRTETISLLSRTLESLFDLGCTVIISSGNHDSASRIGFASKLLARTRVHMVGSVDSIGEPVIVEKDGQALAIYPIPYLEPRAVAGALGVEARHQAVLDRACYLAREDLSHREVTASIIMAHCFVGGATSTDSERDISVGGIGAVTADTFRGFDYAALGHLHGRQKVTERVRYSGSLLAYSFSEENQIKGGWIIDIDSAGSVRINEHRWQNKLALKTLRGTLAELTETTDYLVYGDSICRIYLTDSERPVGAIEKLREHFATVAELYFEPNNCSGTKERYRRISKIGSLETICESFYEHVRGVGLSRPERKYLDTVVQAVRENRESA